MNASSVWAVLEVGERVQENWGVDDAETSTCAYTERFEPVEGWPRFSVHVGEEVVQGSEALAERIGGGHAG